MLKNYSKLKLSLLGILKQLIWMSKIKPLLGKEELLQHPFLLDLITISVMDPESLSIILDKMPDWLTILKTIFRMSLTKKFGIIMDSIDICSTIMGLMLKDLEVTRCTWLDWRIHQNFLDHILWQHWQPIIQKYFQSWKQSTLNLLKSLYYPNYPQQMNRNCRNGINWRKTLQIINLIISWWM